LINFVGTTNDANHCTKPQLVAIVAIKDEQKVVCALSNGYIANDLK